MKDDDCHDIQHMTQRNRRRRGEEKLSKGKEVTRSSMPAKSRRSTALFPLCKKRARRQKKNGIMATQRASERDASKESCQTKKNENELATEEERQRREKGII